MTIKLIKFHRSKTSDVYLNPEHIVVIEPNGPFETTIGMVNATAYVVEGPAHVVADYIRLHEYVQPPRIDKDGT